MGDAEFEELLDLYREISLLTSISSILHWDQEVYLPPDSIEKRSKQNSLLSGMIHQRISSKRIGKYLSSLEGNENLNPEQKSIVREIDRLHRRAITVPEELVRKISKTASIAQKKWAKARKKDDFEIFKPSLDSLISLKKEEAEHIGYDERPYDALLDDYEPYAKTREVSQILDGLKVKMKPIIERIIGSGVVIDTSPVESNFDTRKQKRFCISILEDMGYDFNRGRLDETIHPFTTGSDLDVRITTRYSDGIKIALFSCIHEGGHALYEQGYLEKNYGTPLGEAVSYGLHESQSRMWENMIGRSLPFWEHYREPFILNFPFMDRFTTAEIHRMFNVVKPSFVRVESDEVTYNMHVLIRFEIEKEIFSGNMDVTDIPQEWNTRMEKYLGVEIPNNRLGCLQDIHWSMGAFGYFPTYTLGNLYAAHFLDSMKSDIPDLDDRIRGGDLGSILEWLRENIHQYGKRYKAEELIEKVSGKPPSEEHFVNYIRKKYSKIYDTGL